VAAVIASSRSVVACGQISAARALAWPIRSIISRRLAPVAVWLA